VSSSIRHIADETNKSTNYILCRLVENLRGLLLPFLFGNVRMVAAYWFRLCVCVAFW